jgi:hypothetical protein
LLASLSQEYKPFSFALFKHRGGILGTNLVFHIFQEKKTIEDFAAIIKPF